SKTSPGSWLRAARHDDKNPAFPEPGATRALHRTDVLILPAIDIRGGRCVRLVQGDYAKETVFGDDPAEMAERWLAEGAEAIHIVDLDGARDGTATNREAVLAILRTALVAGRGVVTELGGGIRTLVDVERWLEVGLSRVIVGTAAVEDPNF